MENLNESPTPLDLSISVLGLASSVSGKKEDVINVVRRDFDINEVPSEEQQAVTTTDGNEAESTTTIGINITTKGSDGPPAKKLRLSKEQCRLLEESFQQNHTLNSKMKEELAGKLKLKPRQVEVWFQNQRARNKLKQTEIEYEYLKRWFESLTEQNNKLYKEVEELRTQRGGSSDPFPSSKLVVCARCQRVTTTITTDHGDCINS
ncbi:hypothetical protein OSB04_008846 [Centaurea solstitialis]|uniref:Homeobox domain-containing protein n=1 Tax=Centaurea solstitialis TaxID=347529 RepID=A0AA38U0A9_9ASTR|nr:hypothetical protein OSB04_008846 [Centaurea solstitialis]